MKKTLFQLAAFGAAVAAMATYASAPVAPDFTLPASNGKQVTLSEFKGKYVVLEWWNHQCPFVRKHYDVGNMQKLQKEFTEKGVVWLTICSSKEGAQGYVTADEATEVMENEKGSPSFVLLDPAGVVGKKYEAKTTPQMVLISPKGEILYDGAIDDLIASRGSDVKTAENYLVRAYNEASTGKPVSMPKTKPYGCSVKY